MEFESTTTDGASGGIISSAIGALVKKPKFWAVMAVLAMVVVVVPRLRSSKDEPDRTATSPAPKAKVHQKA